MVQSMDLVRFWEPGGQGASAPGQGSFCVYRGNLRRLSGCFHDLDPAGIRSIPQGFAAGTGRRAILVLIVRG